MFHSLSLDLKRPAAAAGSGNTSSSVPLNAPPAVLEMSSHTVSSSQDTFHTATSPCSPVADSTKCRGGSDDSDELSSTEDSYLRSGGVNISELSTSSFEKVSPPTQIHNNMRHRKSRLMNGKVSAFSVKERELPKYCCHENRTEIRPRGKENTKVRITQQ